MWGPWHGWTRLGRPGPGGPHVSRAENPLIRSSVWGTAKPVANSNPISRRVLSVTGYVSGLASCARQIDRAMNCVTWVVLKLLSATKMMLRWPSGSAGPRVMPSMLSRVSP